jgi:hypothetical protein
LLERRLQAPAFVRQVRHLDALSLAGPAK